VDKSLAQCPELHTKAADLCERQDIAVILGSGSLLEVPLSALIERFERVRLVDIFHMPQVSREAKKLQCEATHR
jgi:hypothetical protein